MAYRAQLVVRTSNPVHAKTIDRIKELADDSSHTISDIALDLLELGLKVRDGNATLTTPAADATETDEERSEGHARSPEATAKPAPRPKVKVKPAPPGGPDEEPDVVAERAVELYETKGAEAAALAVAEFFGAAGPVDGGKVRNELQDRLTQDQFDEIFESLKDMEAYKEYRQRVLYG